MFYSDRPIINSEEDKLNRSSFAKALAKSFAEFNTTDTFSIGLYGKWGSGKTSLINMLISELETQQMNIPEEKRIIIINFEPWNFSNTNQLLTQFFIRLSNELRGKNDKNLLKIGEAIEKYSEAFELTEPIPVVGKALSIFGKHSFSLLGRKLQKEAAEKDIQKQKEYVIELLEKQNRKLLIIIDDIDRLNNEQIRQIFQLITSVAKFPNAIYLLAFDKDIVVKALEKVQEGSGEDYLEKIIQIPIKIPDIQSNKLRKVLLEKLNTILIENPEISFQQIHWQRLFEFCIAPFIKNLRDMNRLANSVRFKLVSLNSEIDFTDMVAISTLEIFLPPIYAWVKENKVILTGPIDLYALARKKTQQEWYEYYSSQIQSLLDDYNCKENNVDSEMVINSLVRLFPYFGQRIGKIYEMYDIDLFRRNNQVAHPHKFDRYFDLDMDDIRLKKGKIDEVVNYYDCEEFQDFLLECDNHDTSHEFLEEVKARISLLTSDRAMVIIKSILNVSADFNSIKENVLSISVKSLANYMIFDLLEVLDSSKRFPYLSDIIQNGSYATMQAVADVINMMELGYGRLAAKGEERGYKKVISLEELIELERIFTGKMKEILQNHNLFDFGDCRMILYLLECFDPDYMMGYLAIAFKNNENIAKYLESVVSTWTGSDTEYEVGKKYQKYLTENRILSAIDSLKSSEIIFSLSKHIQYNCAAFYLKTQGKDNYRGNIPQSEVDKLLVDWENSKGSNDLTKGMRST